MIKWPEIQYVEAEDGMLDPVLEFPKQPEGNIGKYGNMRREYLVQYTELTCLEQTLPEEVGSLTDLLERDARGNVRQSNGNCMLVFEGDEMLRGSLRYNQLTQRIDIVKPLGWEREGIALNDIDEKYIQLHMEECYGLTNDKKIRTAMEITADKNSYHPIRDYLNALSWDGQERIRHALHRYLGAEEDDYTYNVLKLFMLGAILSRIWNMNFCHLFSGFL